MKSSDYSKTPKQDTENCITGDYKELNYTESDNKSHDNSNHGIFCATEKDLDLIAIDNLYWWYNHLCNKLHKSFVWLFCQACTYRALLKGYENFVPPWKY